MQNLGVWSLVDFFLRKSSPTEAKFEKVNFERPEGGDEDVESHVELLAADEEGIVDVSRDDVGLLHQVGVEHRPALPRPLLQLRQLVDQEDATALRLSARLHDPGGVWVLPAADVKELSKDKFHSPPIFLNKHVVICWENEGGWNEVQVEVPP